MSVIQSEVVQCPHCRAQQIQPVAQSINAERSPHFREQIIAGDFQRPLCAHCEEPFEISNPFIYIDIARGNWIGVFPADDDVGWRDAEDAPSHALKVARDAPGGLSVVGSPRVRCVFGLTALREKLWLEDQGLDDVGIEIMKFCLVASVDPANEPIVMEGRTLRVMDLVDDHFELLASVSGHESDARLLSVQRSLYEEILAGGDRWDELRKMLTAGPYVDIGRIFIGGRRRLA